MALFFNALFNFIITIANFFLGPVNSAVSHLFPNFSDMIADFHYFMTEVFGTGVAFVLSWIPPYSRGLVILYIDLLASMYALSWVIHGIVKVIEIIKAVKIW